MRNVNNNAADDSKRNANHGSQVRHRQETFRADQVNRNWNAGDTETAAAEAGAADGGTGKKSVADASRKVSMAPLPTATEPDDEDDDFEEEPSEPQQSPSQAVIGD